jgi:hypothetical protein
MLLRTPLAEVSRNMLPSFLEHKSKTTEETGRSRREAQRQTVYRSAAALLQADSDCRCSVA